MSPTGTLEYGGISYIPNIQNVKSFVSVGKHSCFVKVDNEPMTHGAPIIAPSTSVGLVPLVPPPHVIDLWDVGGYRMTNLYGI